MMAAKRFIPIIALSIALLASATAIYTAIQLQGISDRLEGGQESLGSAIEELSRRVEGLLGEQERIKEEIAKPKILYTLKDGLGRLIVVVQKGAEIPEGLPEEAVIVRVPAERIVSFAPSITGTLFKIGLGDKVVAVTKWAEWPEEVVKKKEAGEVVVLQSIIEPEVEKIVATKPDLILTIKLKPEKLEVFRELGIPVVVINYGDSIEDIVAAVLLIGRVTGNEEGAAALASSIQERVEEIRKAVGRTGRDRVRVFWLVWHDPLMTAGGPSFITAMLDVAGGENIFKDVEKAWPIISREEVLARNPQVIFLTEGFKERGIASKEDLLRLFPEWSEIDAIKGDRVYIVPDATVQPGPRTPDMIELLAKLLHGIELRTLEEETVVE